MNLTPGFLDDEGIIPSLASSMLFFLFESRLIYEFFLIMLKLLKELFYLEARFVKN